MKSIIIAASVLFFLSACRKEYSCTCINTLATTQMPVKTTSTIKAASRSEAEKQCDKPAPAYLVCSLDK